MPLSRNVNRDKMSACHQGHEGYTDCNVGQTWSVDYHLETNHWWGSNIVMRVYRYDELSGRQGG